MKNILTDLFSSFRTGTRSLKTQLTVYFLPLIVLPVLGMGYYATRLFEQSTLDSLARRANSELESLSAEINRHDALLLENIHDHARNTRLVQSIAMGDTNAIEEAMLSLNTSNRLRVFNLEGRNLYRKVADSEDTQIAYLSKAGLKKVKLQNESVERYFSDNENAILTVARVLIRDKSKVYGVLEEEAVFSKKKLEAFKTRRQVDVLVASRDLSQMMGSFSLSKEDVKKAVTQNLIKQSDKNNTPVFVNFSDIRFASFLFDLDFSPSKKQNWGYVAVFVPMTASDSISIQLKWNMVAITAVLCILFVFLLFYFSNRIVKPIEYLVLAMKRAKTGRIEQIPNTDSTYEIEYLVRVFNDMSRNITNAKRTLEGKVDELKDKNQEIKDTQTQLFQSAKMISLGQIVAGVAHELNNPIAFIHSNMHHLTDYLERFRLLVSEYRKIMLTLPASEQEKIKKVEGDLEIEYILKDMEDLIRSVVDGANRTKEIVLSLRTFSRVEESNFQLSDIVSGIKSTLKLLSPELKGRIEVHEEINTVPQIECSLSQLNQVFMNLISNAAHAIEGKGHIWIRVYEAENGVAIEIEDSGAGISKENLDKIFDPFFTTKKVGKGTGLGLSIAYNLIQKHSGRIFVDSEMNKGTKFTLWLPLIQEQSESA